MTGSESTISDSIIRLMSPLIFLTGLSNIFGIQGMVSLGYNLEFKRILLMSGILNIILTIPLSYYLEVQGTALSTLITELVITIAMGLFLYRRQPVLFKVHF
jgi:O-antigen/teichoic acid export membrane protein